MFRSYITAFGFLMLTCVAPNASSQIPDKVKTEMLLASAIQQAERSQFEGAKTSIAAYRKKVQKISPAVELLDAQVTFLTGDDIGAFGKLSTYFKKAKESDPAWAQAVEMATLLKDLELPYLLARIPEKELRDKPYAHMKKIAGKGYNTTEIQTLAVQGNLRAMYMYGVIYDEKGKTSNDAIQAEVYLEMACQDGFKLACIRLRGRYKRSLWDGYRKLYSLLSIGETKTDSTRSRSGKRQSLKGIVKQQVSKKPESVCRTGKFTLSQWGRWEYHKNGKTKKFPIVSGIPLNSRTLKIDLNSLYDNNLDSVHMLKTRKTGGDLFEAWNDSILVVEMDSLEKNKNGVLFNSASKSSLNKAVENFMFSCNYIMPRLETNFTPLRLNSNVVTAPKTIATPQKNSKPIGSISRVTPSHPINSNTAITQLPNTIGQILTVDTNFGFVTAKVNGLQIGDTVRTQTSSGQIIPLTVAKKSNNGGYSLIPKNNQDIKALKPGYPIAK